jgi:undecaprenyl phosphate N,N'-diacetylbacillosamine 1-phosphate transferase
VYKKEFKITFDFIIALLAFILLSPVFIVLTLSLFVVNKGKVFFFQKRPGKNEKIFTIIKFKTMSDEFDQHGELLPDELRLTTIGKFVRRTSLDEIPQLLNVIMGNMSLVGPRPLLPQYLTLYNEFQRQRHTVKPGITGWAQVHGRNAISWKDKFKLDVYYVEHQSFALDITILLKTMGKVLKFEGITDGITQTSTYFKGNEEER